MKSLNRPQADPTGLLTSCIENIADRVAQAGYIANQQVLEQGALDYETASTGTVWCDLPRVPNGQADRVVVGTLTKRQLMDLYSKHMVGSSGSAREAYDAILVAANGKCPFCGGIGHAKTLDHYLPKANFPLYSIVPTNLVPCCRDCNTGKSNAFPMQVSAQSLHPYLDAAHFFAVKWTHADIVATDPVSAAFSARPPDTWSACDQQRVISHFEDYDLATRYSIEAGTEIANLVYLRKTTFHGYPPDSFEEYLREQSNSPATPINGWRRTLFAALADARWFVESVY